MRGSRSDGRWSRAGRLVAVAATASVVAGAVALPASAQGTAPAIDVWYGDVQHVGATGHTQQWANVLGRVTDPDGDVA